MIPVRLHKEKCKWEAPEMNIEAKKEVTSPKKKNL